MELLRDADVSGSDNSLDVNAVVLVETFVLYSNKGVRQILRNHVVRDRDSVRILGNQLGGLIPFKVVDESGKTGRGNLDVFDAGSSINDSLENPKAHTDSNHAYR